MMKNVNVQREVEYCQKYEKIEDLCPRVCTSIREQPCFVLCVLPWHVGVLEDHLGHEAFVLVFLLLDLESI